MLEKIPRGWVRVVAAGCIHGRFGGTLDPLVKLLEDTRPHVFVNLGDNIDADGAMRFPKERKQNLLHEYENWNAGLARIRAVLPRRCQMVFLVGNHEDNVSATLRIDPALRDICSIWRNVPEIKKYTHRPYVYDRRGVASIGQFDFAHGYETSASGLRGQPLALSGFNRLLVHAHTHRPTDGIMRVPLGSSYNAPDTGFSWCDVGTWGDLKPDYMTRQRTDRWGTAAFVGACNPNAPHLSPTREWEGHIVHFERDKD